MEEPPPSGAVASPADWRERLAARAIDGAAFAVLYWILSLVFHAVLASGDADRGTDPRALPGLFAGLIAFGAYLLYDCAAHARSGRTAGKKAMGIRVVSYGGAAPSPSALMKRAVLCPGVLLASGIPLLNLPAAVLGFAAGLFILLDLPLRQGLHDKLAGTVVVKDPR
ncbi:RDD family protein [Planomonospora venezuelensis]|uniref:Putative RDD family membrane protein YckC n=1 Tax=Planomonospora venezuelensis TaxID=1999 RepID=A0A841D8G3_PLAVE|nr:putative RDD family membrane protein YckC [Planomonospora venezuelensis]